MIVRSTEEAQRLAEEHLARVAMRTSVDPAILVENTVKTDFGWVFFWTSKKYLETQKFEDALAGNAPLIVDKRDGTVHETSTAYPIDEMIERYRKANPVTL